MFRPLFRQRPLATASLFALLTACTANNNANRTTDSAFEATVYRTSGGIPHIIADDWGSIGYGTGYAAAEDHLCKLARNALKFRGKLAANFGPGDGNLNSDFFFKLLEKEGIFEEAIDTEFERLFAGYAAGFNRYLRDKGIDNVSDPACSGADWVQPLSAEDQRLRLRGIIGQIAVLAIAFQQPLAFQKTPDTVSDGVCQLGEFGARRRLRPLEPNARSIGAIDVDTIQKEHVSVLARLAHTCSAPVSSDVSPKHVVAPSGSTLSMKLPTVGLEARPEVVSDSPHLTDTHRSAPPHSSRRSSVAQCKNSLALRLVRAMVSMSPCCSIENPSTGLPVLRMPSTTRPVQPGSIPMTTTATNRVR